MRKYLSFALVAFPLMQLCGAVAVAAAQPSPQGVWIDHTGRGAVEITDCNGALCGHVVWVKDARDAEGCNMQIIGNVKPVSGGRWDGGWIWDPDRRGKFDVELTPIGDQKLKVHGYAGIKMFGETMTWTRAPADLKKCGQTETQAASPEVKTQPQAAAPAAQPQQDAQSVTPRQPEQRAPDATVATPQNESNPRSEMTALRDALGSMLQFSDRPAGGGKKTCTLSVKDFGKFSFPC